MVGRRFFFLFRMLLGERRWRTGPRERAVAGGWSGEGVPFSPIGPFPPPTSSPGEDVRMRENVSEAMVLAGGGSDGCNEGGEGP